MQVYSHGKNIIVIYSTTNLHTVLNRCISIGSHDIETFQARQWCICFVQIYLFSVAKQVTRVAQYHFLRWKSLRLAILLDHVIQ